MKTTAIRRRRFTPLALAAGILGSAVLGLGATGTFSAFTATVSNTTNTTGAGSLVMVERDGNTAASCTSNGAGSTDNTYTCGSINKYGGQTNLAPGGTSQDTVKIFSTGSRDATAFTLSPQTCTLLDGTTPASICGWLNLKVVCTVYRNGTPDADVTVYDGSHSTSTLSSIAQVDLATKGCIPPKGLDGGTSYTSFAFTVTLDTNAPNSVQGQTAKQQLDWQFRM